MTGLAVTRVGGVYSALERGHLEYFTRDLFYTLQTH